MTDLKGIIFDYGGTLDTHGEHWSEVILRGWQAAGIDVPRDTFRECYVYGERALAREPIVGADDDFRTMLLKKAVKELERLAQIAPQAMPADLDAAAAAIADYCDDRARATVLSNRPALESLARRWPLMLVSNFYGNIDSVLRAYGIRHLFQGIIESAVVGVRKPDPRIFMLGVVALGFDPADILVVGDSLRKDILPAESIGCRTAWIKGSGWDDSEDTILRPDIFPSVPALASTLLP